MKKIIALLCLFFFAQNAGWAQQHSLPKWISTMKSQSAANTWLAFRKIVEIHNKPMHAIAKIAVDSKYWLWINDKLVILEGGLKRGPNPTDTYYDEIDIASYIKDGNNSISVLVWYFGKDGFSHKSSGRAGLFFDCQDDTISIVSDKTWRCSVAPAYQTAGHPFPNFRLPESSILYDARLDMGKWQMFDYDDSRMPFAIELGEEGAYPWNKLIKRPIPFFKDFGLKDYVNKNKMDTISQGDTIICLLPYNAQIHPYLKVDAHAGEKIVMATDNYLFYGAAQTGLRAEYITKNGIQEFESPGWINGQKVYYFIPKGIKILSLRFRETGYDTELSGHFNSSDPFLNKLWEKAQRTLYLNMRDNYMDCPERERAQWTGDAVNESGQAFYALSLSSHALTKKWLHELINWQKKDGSLYAPVPAGNWMGELPGQSAASIGYFGLWNYYLHTGDKQTIKDLYDGCKKYLTAWKPDGNGTMQFREGDWTWGDWGEHKDMLPLFNLWYYLGVKGMHLIAMELKKDKDAVRYASFMEGFKQSFNHQFWTGKEYRDPAYKGQTDDRVQALAVVSGIADKPKYPALLKIFEEHYHASPYMEKYIFEAMFQMGYEKQALYRQEKRFESMVNNKKFSTLFEVWDIDENGKGSGTINHAWSGGGLTVISQYICGVAPLKPGYHEFQILPQPGPVKSASLTLQSVAGEINTSFENLETSFHLSATVPDGTSAIIGVPNNGYHTISLNNKVVWSNGSFKNYKGEKPGLISDSNYVKFKLNQGEWKFIATR